MATLIIIVIILIVLIFTNKNFFGIYLLNYILGLILILLFPDFSKNDAHVGQSSDALIVMYEIFYFSIFYFISISYLLIPRRNRKISYYIIPIISYILIIISFFSDVDYKYWLHIFLAFFPSHIYSYFKLKKMNKI
jgi:hypothetical protein